MVVGWFENTGLLNGCNLQNTVIQLKQLHGCNLEWGERSRMGCSEQDFRPCFVIFDLVLLGLTCAIKSLEFRRSPLGPMWRGPRHGEGQAAGAGRVRKEMRISAACTICTMCTAHTPLQSEDLISGQDKSVNGETAMQQLCTPTCFKHQLFISSHQTHNLLVDHQWPLVVAVCDSLLQPQCYMHLSDMLFTHLKAEKVKESLTERDKATQSHRVSLAL